VSTLNLADGAVLHIPEGLRLIDITTAFDDRRQYTLCLPLVAEREDRLAAAALQVRS
jgi:hypothetical protein